MPLLPGKKNIGKNIKTEIAAGKPRKQAIAIALNVDVHGKKSTTKKIADQYHKSKGTAKTADGIGIINKALGGRFG